MTTMRASGRAAPRCRHLPSGRAASRLPSLRSASSRAWTPAGKASSSGFGDGRPSYSTSRRIFEVSVAPPKAHSRIDHYEFGQIVVDARQETKDLIILPDRVVRNWWRRDGHALVLDDPVEVLDELPPHLVVGTGAHGRMRPDPTTLQQLWERGVTVETLPTGQVVRRFAALDPAGTAAALHLTC
jgi:hypothetical protein